MAQRGPKLNEDAREVLMGIIELSENSQLGTKSNCELARVFKVAEGTVRYWKKKMQTGKSDDRKLKKSGVSKYDPVIRQWINSGIESKYRESFKILHELLIEHHGFSLSYDALRRYMQKHFPDIVQKPKRFRLETPPGMLLQIDWKEDVRIQIGKPGNWVNRHFFVCVLGFSRGAAVITCSSRETESFLWAHLEAFKRLNGLPEVIRPDCMKTAVIQWKGEKSKINEQYSSYLSQLGIRVFPSRPGTAQDKGKVEKKIRDLIESTSFRNRVFKDDDDLQQYLDDAVQLRMKHWRAASTGLSVAESLEYERKHLKPLPEVFPRIPTSHKRTKVKRDGTIYFEGNYYQIPDVYIDCSVTCMRFGREILVYHEGKLIEKSVKPADAKGMLLLSEKAIRETSIPLSDTARTWCLNVAERQISIYEEICGGAA